VETPGLEARREDIPLVARALLRNIAASDPDAVAAFFPRGDFEGIPRLNPRFVRMLVAHRYRTHVRELASLLWQSIEQSPGDELRTPEVAELASPAADAELTRDEIEAALDANGWVVKRTADALQLSSRYVLMRLMKKHGIATKR
jgi:DNA-binding NtrC family response regulator